MLGSRVRKPEARFAIAAHVASAALFASFVLPAALRVHAAGGGWAPPAPLDDVFIHFGFARSLALGHPMEWIPGNGFSSGATSLLYPVLLAPGWLLGLRGAALGWFALAIGVLATADFVRSMFALGRGAPTPVRALAALGVLFVPFVDWNLCSGMETAVFAAALGRASMAVERVEAAPPSSRPRAQRHAGLWLAALVAVRPEGAAFVAPFAVAVAHAAGAGSASRAAARAASPALLLLAGQAALNWAFTGEVLAAGAVRKLVWTNPYASSPEVALEIVKNAVALREQALVVGLGGGSVALVPWALALFGARDARTRRLVVALVASALLAFALVCLNATARFQNLRYAAPTVLGLLAAAAVGAAALARRGVAGGAFAALLLVAVAVAEGPLLPRQIDHFARASTNIARQQVEVARRLGARAPPPRRVFVNDAGAIAYLTNLPAIDGLGLGGFRELPFARASVHGPAAVLELLERLPPDDRPDVLAIYPGWWPGLADEIGVRSFSVRIPDNVICGSDELVVFDVLRDRMASRIGADDLLDELDTADLVDEAAHDYAFDHPHAGWVVGAAHLDGRGVRTWDGGRAFPRGTGASFRVAFGVASGAARIVVRTDGDGALTLSARLLRRGAFVAEREVGARPGAPGAWRDVEVAFDDLRGGDRIRLEARAGELRHFHTWLKRSGDAVRLTPRSPSRLDPVAPRARTE